MSLGGHFIALEGIDGAGTTTQMGRLSAWVEAQGGEVVQTFEPTDGPIGAYIRQVLRGQTAAPPHDAIALLFAADRVDHLARQIDPATGRGAHVVCDRYLGSSLAYQGTHSDPDWVRRINSQAREPDLTIYIRCRPAVALARIQARDGARRELFEHRDTLTRIAAAYDRIYGFGERRAVLEAVTVDGEAPRDAVTAAVIAAAETLSWR